MPIKHRVAILVSTWFGCGLSPFAPGTAGSLAALVIGILLHEYAGFTWWHFLLLAAIAFVPATWAADVTAKVKKLKDPQIVVVDEVLGQWIALAGAPLPLEELPGRLCAVSPLRHLEAAARAAIGSPSRRPRHQCGRRDGRRIRRTCLIRGGMLQSLLVLCLSGNHLIPSPASPRSPRPPLSPAVSCRFGGRGLPGRIGRR